MQITNIQLFNLLNTTLKNFCLTYWEQLLNTTYTYNKVDEIINEEYGGDVDDGILGILQEIINNYEYIIFMDQNTAEITHKINLKNYSGEQLPGFLSNDTEVVAAGNKHHYLECYISKGEQFGETDVFFYKQKKEIDVEKEYEKLVKSKWYLSPIDKMVSRNIDYTKEVPMVLPGAISWQFRKKIVNGVKREHCQCENREEWIVNEMVSRNLPDRVNSRSMYPLHCTGDDGTVVEAGTTVATDTSPEVRLYSANDFSIERESCTISLLKNDNRF